MKSRAKTAARRLHGSSHSFAQRERPLAYLELHARAAADVLRRREQGGELARRRFGQLASARAIVAATLARDPDGLAAPARKLERDTAGESEPYLEVLVGFLVYVLFPAGSLRARRGRGAALAGALHAAWPRDAVRLRRALARAAADGRGLAWSLLPRGPWRRRSPRLLLDARS